MNAGRDLLDAQIEVRPGLNISDVVLTFSDKHTEISGSLQTAAGRPASDYSVVVFPASSALWGVAVRRIKSTRPANDGTFAVRDLPAGDYLIAALDDLDPADLNDPRFFQQLVPAALKLTLLDGERKTQDLVLAR